MQLPIAEPTQKKRGTSVPVTKKRQEKVKKCRKQQKSKEMKLNPIDGAKFKSQKNYTKYEKRKNRGYSNEHNEEINSLILNLWEKHYIECPGGNNEGGGKQEQSKEQKEEKQKPQGNENPNKNSNKNSSSNKSRSQKPTSEELNIIDQELHIFYGPFYFEFIEDAFQLEALYYQLSLRNFFRTPITSCPPVIAQYLFSLFFSFQNLSHLEIITNNCPYTKSILEKIEKGEIQVRRGLLQLFKSVNIEDHFGLPKQFQEYQSFIIKIIKDNQNLNLRLLIDDFIKYSKLYSNNQNVYMQHLENQQHKKHNLCFGFLRFSFLCYDEIDQSGKAQNVYVRIPLGDFQFSSLQDPRDTINMMDRTLHKEDWFEKQKGKPHSEKVLLSWIILNCQALAQQVSLKLASIKSTHLVLEKVYLEITSELRVCHSCIDMLLAFPHFYVSDLILQELKLKEQKLIRIHEEFHLIVVTQFLHESQNRGNFSLRQRVQSVKNSRKKTVYIEAGYVGLITENYFKNRYLSNKQQIFTQQIDEFLIKNTFFVSDDLVEELPQQQNIQQNDNQSTSSHRTSTRALIYSPMMTALNKIQKDQTQLKQISPIFNKQTLYQERILQCYQLIWKYYSKLGQPLNELDVHLFQMHLQQWIIFDFQIHLEYHFDFLKTNTCFENISYQEIVQLIQNSMDLYNVFDRGNSNTKLLFLDYIFLNRYAIDKPQLLGLSTWQKNQKQSVQQNLGHIKIFITTQSAENNGKIQIMVDPKDQLSEFLKQLTAVLQYKLHELVVKQVEILISSIQQLSSEMKSYLQQQIIGNEGDVKFDFYYMYFRQLSSESGMNQYQDEQFFLYDPNQFETRYSKLNDQSQTPFFDMKEDQLGSFLCFNENEKNYQKLPTN